MIELLTAPESLPFAVALVVMLAISMLEGVGTVLGLSLSAVLDSMLPDFDLGVDVEAPQLDAQPSGFTAVLGWLRFGHVPALVLLIVFLTAFCLRDVAGKFVLFLPEDALPIDRVLPPASRHFVDRRRVQP